MCIFVNGLTLLFQMKVQFTNFFLKMGYLWAWGGLMGFTLYFLGWRLDYLGLVLGQGQRLSLYLMTQLFVLLLLFNHFGLNSVEMFVFLLEHGFKLLLLLFQLGFQSLDFSPQSFPISRLHSLPFLLQKIFLLTLESLADDCLFGVVVTGPLHFEIHQPLQSDNPAPLFLCGVEAKIIGLKISLHFEGRGQQILLLPDIARVLLHLCQVNGVRVALFGVVLEDQYEVVGEHYPSFLPFLRLIRTQVEQSLPHLPLQLVFNCTWIHYLYY